eukprot:9146121-Prorocentrum_lima.AAC.1
MATVYRNMRECHAHMGPPNWECHNGKPRKLTPYIPRCPLREMVQYVFIYLTAITAGNPNVVASN